MAVINPNIILNAVQQQRAGTSPFSNLKHIIQFQDLIEQRKTREAQNQKQQTISDLIGKHTQSTDQGVSLNQVPFIQELAQIDPQAALQQQAIVQQQALQAQKIQAQKEKAIADEKIALSKASEAELKQARDVQNMVGSAAGAVLNAAPENQQQILDEQLDRLIDSGVISKEMLQSGKIPMTVNPQSLASLQAIQQTSLTSKEQLDFELKSRETPIKETAAQKAERDRKEGQDVFKSQIDSRFVDRLKKGRRLDKKAVETVRRFHASAPTVLSQIGDLESLVNNSNLADLKNPASDAAAEMGTILGNIQFQVKELFELGALQAPDLELIDRLTGNPSSIGISNVRKKSTTKRLNQMSKNLVRMFNNKVNTLGIGKFDKNEILSLGSEPVAFGSLEEAEKANLPKGTIINISGREAVVE